MNLIKLLRALPLIAVLGLSLTPVAIVFAGATSSPMAAHLTPSGVNGVTTWE